MIRRLAPLLFALPGCALLAGCGPSQEELREQQQAEARAAEQEEAAARALALREAAAAEDKARQAELDAFYAGENVEPVTEADALRVEDAPESGTGQRAVRTDPIRADAMSYRGPAPFTPPAGAAPRAGAGAPVAGAPVIGYDGPSQ